jgi:lipoprotein LprG
MTRTNSRGTWQAVRVRRLLVAALALTLLLCGCSGGSGAASSSQSPEKRLAAARRNLDSASYVGFTMTATSLPKGLQGLLSATGTGTHAPAFTGTVKVQSGVDLTAPLIAVDGRVYAKLPFAGWSRLNPADYGAPNPADLMDPGGGVSSLLAATEHLHEGGSQRVGDKVLTSIDGTVPGAAMRRVFPSSGAEDFSVSYLLTDDNSLDSVRVTGPFYPAAGTADVTYDISIDTHARSVDIKAPI